MYYGLQGLPIKNVRVSRIVDNNDNNDKQLLSYKTLLGERIVNKVPGIDRVIAAVVQDEVCLSGCQGRHDAERLSLAGSWQNNTNDTAIKNSASQPPRIY